MSPEAHDSSRLCWTDSCVSAYEVQTIQLAFGLAEGLTLVITQADGAALVAPYAKISPTELREFIDIVERTGRGVRIPRGLRRG